MPSVAPMTVLAGAIVAALLPPVAEAEAPRSGAQVYQTYCGACHGSGWQGAPMAGVKGDWETRLAAGFDALLKNARQGFSTMPAKGTCADCSDAELKAAIEEMLKF